MSPVPQVNPHLRNRLLASLPQKEFAHLEPFLREVALLPRDSLHRPGEPIDQVYFLHSGVVSLMALMEGGAMVEAGSIGHEGAIGTIEGFGSLRAFTSSIVQVPGSASRISSANLRQAIGRSGELREIINHYHMAVMSTVQQTAACNALHDLTKRLSRILLLTGDRCDNDFRLTQEALAEMIGVTRTSLTVAARQLRGLGAIEYGRGIIRITNREKLENQVCECYRTIRRSIDLGFWPNRS
jgi:CRP-like cAMP-binding protein